MTAVIVNPAGIAECVLIKSKLGEYAIADLVLARGIHAQSHNRYTRRSAGSPRGQRGSRHSQNPRHAATGRRKDETEAQGYEAQSTDSVLTEPNHHALAQRLQDDQMQCALPKPPVINFILRH